MCKVTLATPNMKYNKCHLISAYVYENKRHRKTEVFSPKSRHKLKRQQSLGPLSPVDDPDNTARSNFTNDGLLDESSIEKKKAKQMKSLGGFCGLQKWRKRTSSKMIARAVSSLNR